MTWWAETPENSLSQGDVITGVPVAVVLHPRTQLSKQAVKGFPEAWIPSAEWKPQNNDVGHLLGRGRVIPVIVITESCQLDKSETKGRVVVAPVYPMSGLRADEADIVIAQKRRSKMPLPDVPGNVGPSYADLRMATAVDQQFLPLTQRVAQLSKDGVARLQIQLIAFFTGIDAQGIHAALMSVVATPE